MRVAFKIHQSDTADKGGHREIELSGSAGNKASARTG